MTPTTVTDESIEELLYSLREQGWTDTQIATTLRINRSTIWRWRIGLRAPRPDMIVRMALHGLLRQQPP